MVSQQRRRCGRENFVGFVPDQLIAPTSHFDMTHQQIWPLLEERHGDLNQLEPKKLWRHLAATICCRMRALGQVCFFFRFIRYWRWFEMLLCVNKCSSWRSPTFVPPNLRFLPMTIDIAVSHGRHQDYIWTHMELCGNEKCKTKRQHVLYMFYDRKKKIDLFVVFLISA